MEPTCTLIPFLKFAVSEIVEKAKQPSTERIHWYVCYDQLENHSCIGTKLNREYNYLYSNRSEGPMIIKLFFVYNM
jgi:hypothetical protein